MEKKITIKLFDDTLIECELNGNCYITEQPIDETVDMTDDNLITIFINNQVCNNMHCDNLWRPHNDQEHVWFILREKTTQELFEERIQATLDFLLVMQGV